MPTRRRLQEAPTDTKARASAALRREMVASLEARGAITTKAVRDAFLAVAREHFVPELVERDGLAAIYRADIALATATDARGVAISASSAPAVMAPMLEALQLEPGQRVLEIGAGTGYNAALVKHLVGPEGEVTTVDLEASLAHRARRGLAAAGYAARVVVGDGSAGGWPGAAPYDRIIVTASAAEIYRPWRDQLVEGGLLEVPLRLAQGPTYQLIATFARHGEQLRSTTAIVGSFMPLRGGQGDEKVLVPPESLRALAGGTTPRLLASLEGPDLERRSTKGRRRALATLLGPSRRIATLPREEAGGLIAFLALKGRGPICLCVADGRWGAGVLACNGGSVATVTQAVGVGRIDLFGEEDALVLLRRYRDEWRARGRPSLGDLRLSVSFGTPPSGRAWRRVVRGDSVVAVDWGAAPR